MITAPAPPVLPRPTVVDFFLVVTGFGLSLFLSQISPMTWQPRDDLPSLVMIRVVPVLPELLHLREGVILLWPFFLAFQRLLGRDQGLTSGEWLWVFAWLGTFLVFVLAAWKQWGPIPPPLDAYASWPFVLWYLIVVPSMGLLALLLIPLGLIRRRPVPWTHSLGLVLMLWPLLPLGGLLALSQLR